MKTVQKLIPVSLYDIPGLEAWLEEQANQGLFPTHLGLWATFEDTGVPGTRFPAGALGQDGKRAFAGAAGALPSGGLAV